MLWDEIKRDKGVRVAHGWLAYRAAWLSVSADRFKCAEIEAQRCQSTWRKGACEASAPVSGI